MTPHFSLGFWGWLLSAASAFMMGFSVARLLDISRRRRVLRRFRADLYARDHDAEWYEGWMAAFCWTMGKEADEQ